MNHSDLTQEFLSNFFNNNKSLTSPNEKENTSSKLEAPFAVHHPTITIPGPDQIKYLLTNL